MRQVLEQSRGLGTGRLGILWAEYDGYSMQKREWIHNNGNHHIAYIIYIYIERESKPKIDRTVVFLSSNHATISRFYLFGATWG
jgi:hypothetical protein